MTSLEASDSKKLGSIFTPEQDKFLNHKHKAKLLTQFKVGKNEVSIYGNLIWAAKKSPVLEEMIDRFAESDPPYYLMTTMQVEERALQVIWLYLHEINYDEETISKLNPIELLNVFDIMWYLDLCKNTVYSKGCYSPWCYAFKRMIAATDKSILLDNKYKIVEIINKVVRFDTTFFHPLLFRYNKQAVVTRCR
jgi:hypothetical protein